MQIYQPDGTKPIIAFRDSALREQPRSTKIESKTITTKGGTKERQQYDHARSRLVTSKAGSSETQAICLSAQWFRRRTGYRPNFADDRAFPPSAWGTRSVLVAHAPQAMRLGSQSCNTSPPERGGKTRIQNSSVPPAASTPLLAEILQRDLDALVVHALELSLELFPALGAA